MESAALSLIKSRLGISTTVRDTYLISIINGVVDELKIIQGIVLDEESAAHLMFVVDYAEYRYSNRDNPIMPRHLQWRLHNLVIGGGSVV
jgi:hypothetical protein